MGKVYTAPTGGLVQGEDLTARANNVMSGYTYLGTDTEDTGGTGALTLSGTATVGDVAAGKTFYNNSPQTKRTGTLALSGNALASNILKGKTFYSNNLKAKLTGTAEIVIPNGEITEPGGTMQIPARRAAFIVVYAVGIDKYPDFTVTTSAPCIITWEGASFRLSHTTFSMDTFLILNTNDEPTSVTLRANHVAFDSLTAYFFVLS